MKDTVTFETAARLKEAGFPQPTPEAGQWWYNPDFGPFLVGKLWMVDGRLRNIFYPDTGKVVNKEIRLFPDCVFAPTATDILRGLSSDCVLGTKKLGGWICGSWRLISADHMRFFVAGMHDENPAEAAAEAWLKLHNKK